MPEDDEVIVSTNKGEPLSGTSDNQKAGQAYRNIARRLQGEEIPLLDLDSLNSTWFSKVVKFFNPVLQV